MELHGSVRKDCSSLFDDWNGAFFENDGIEKLKGMENEIARLQDVAGDERIGACIARPWKVICIGLNYRDHAEESGMEIPAEPVIFMKSSRTVTGPNDDILIPPGSKKQIGQSSWASSLARNAGMRNPMRRRNRLLRATASHTTCRNGSFNLSAVDSG